MIRQEHSRLISAKIATDPDAGADSTLGDYATRANIKACAAVYYSPISISSISGNSISRAAAIKQAMAAPMQHIPARIITMSNILIMPTPPFNPLLQNCEPIRQCRKTCVCSSPGTASLNKSIPGSITALSRQ